jgi:3-deoxy-manno-octulosonate cytidylyltransferase (CMP-KDO synthetase)
MKNTLRYQFAGIIPARYASTRFPGKPLVIIGGKPMVQHVYEQSAKALGIVYVATDDIRIKDAVEGFGGKAVMTSDRHQSGTDRCAEAARLIEEATGEKIEIVINIQGDEPFLRPTELELLSSCFNDTSVEIATLVRKALPGEDIFNPNQPKAVLSKSGDAIYFSRAAIPYVRGVVMDDWAHNYTYYLHLGIYAYKVSALNSITLLERSSLETAESLEQNRWIENGFRIRTAVTEWNSISIDTPEDLEKAIQHYEH